MIDRKKAELATFAGGCFWCLEPPFDAVKGVEAVMPGYIGGRRPNPTYEQVCTGTTGHAEAVQVTFDPSKVTYEQLLDVFWHNIDPTTLNAQFADEGTQYRTGIFYHSEVQKRLAEESKKRLDQAGVFQGPIVTEITKASTFYPAEEYHQKYYQKCPLRYNAYKLGSGRQGFLQKTWSK